MAAGSLRSATLCGSSVSAGSICSRPYRPESGQWLPCLKLPEGKLEDILAEAAQGEVVGAANFNSPDQVVIAGHAGAVQRAMDLAKAAGAKRAVPLPVSASFPLLL